MNRNFFLIPVAVLVVLAFEFLGSDASETDLASSPRANQYHEKIKELVSIGGGSITESCRVSLKHTVLVTCPVNIANVNEIEKSLRLEGWQQVPGTEPEEYKYKKQDDLLTVLRNQGRYVISLKAGK